MKFDFTIEGTSDLMTHNPLSMFLAASAGGAPTKGTKKDVIPQEVAETACYRLSDGSCGIPVLAIRGALIEASKDFKVPGNRYSLARLMKGCEVAPMEFVPILRDGEPITSYTVDSRRAVNKNTKGAIIVHRPKYAAGWQVKFQLILDDALFSMAEDEVEKVMRAVLDDAGRRVGIGSFRPANGGWFGRFKVL